MRHKHLSVNQVAQLKGVSRNAVYKAVQQKRLASIRVMGIIAVRTQDAEAWIPKSRTGQRKGVRPTEETKKKMSEAHKKRWLKRKGNE